MLAECLRSARSFCSVFLHRLAKVRTRALARMRRAMRRCDNENKALFVAFPRAQSPCDRASSPDDDSVTRPPRARACRVGAARPALRGDSRRPRTPAPPRSSGRGFALLLGEEPWRGRIYALRARSAARGCEARTAFPGPRRFLLPPRGGGREADHRRSVEKNDLLRSSALGRHVLSCILGPAGGSPPRGRIDGLYRCRRRRRRDVKGRKRSLADRARLFGLCRRASFSGFLRPWTVG